MRKSFLIPILFAAVSLVAQELKPVTLPAPNTDGGRPLMQVLKERKTAREFSPEKLPVQLLSNLLWAAAGTNRPDGHRTVPSAMNWQEVQVYVATAEGAYLYDAKANQLVPIVAGDLRALTGTQDFVAAAPVNLIYVADLSRIKQIPEVDTYVAADAGFISQNVYLFCASERLATVVRGSVDRPALAKAMKLRVDQKIILTQTVGYPKK